MKRSIIHLGLFAMSLALGASSRAAADDSVDAAQAKAKLAEIRGKIAAVTGRLSEELKQRDALGARLREADLSITAKRRRLESLRGAEMAAEKRRGELQAEEFQVQGALAAQRAALAAQARAAYMMGRQERLKLLLNQGDPANAGRMFAYYGFFARERLQKILVINERVSRMQELVALVDQSTDKLQALQIDAAHEVSDLQHARAERVRALAKVSEQLKTGNEQLAELEREETAEESLVADLARVLQDFPVDTQQSFEALRGKLPWPVAGRMTTRYQDARASASATSFRWNGVLIEATRGAKVRAPYYGRVVYADWLQGLGLLLIIGHKGNYLTLYGHAEVLYKSVGDWVAPGDVIAALADSGGTPPQLYFEIRDGRTPRDPRAWLKPAP